MSSKLITECRNLIFESSSKCYGFIEQFKTAETDTLQEYGCYLRTIVTFFLHMFPVLERNYQKRKKVYRFLSTKKNPIGDICREYHNSTQRYLFETDAQKIVDEAILTLDGQKDRDFFEVELGKNLMFYFEGSNDDEEEKFYYDFSDVKTGIIFDHHSGMELIPENLMREIALFSYLGKKDWLKNDG